MKPVLESDVHSLSNPQLQSSVTEFEFSQEEYRQLQVEFWSKFHACCLQYQEALSTPMGLTVSPHTSMVCLLKKVRVEMDPGLIGSFNCGFPENVRLYSLSVQVTGD